MKKALYVLAIIIIIIIILLIIGKKHISSEIIINAPVNKVMIELTDFSKYPDWNPFIRKVSGEIKKGNIIEVVLQPPGGSSYVFRPEIIIDRENNIFQWEGKLFLPGIFTGRHTFELVHLEKDRTRFIQKEDFNGILVPFINLESTIEGFNSMNRELKTIVEERYKKDIK